jgi:hypothetical protein
VIFGDKTYEALFWYQIAISTELPWSVVYPDDPHKIFCSCKVYRNEMRIIVLNIPARSKLS